MSAEESPAPAPSETPTHTSPTSIANPAALVPAPQPSASWQSLGRRIASRTTDLLAIALIVIVSLTMGQQILRWWGTDAPQVLDLGALDSLSTDWGANSRPVELEFGDGSVTMTRQVLGKGGQPAAIAVLRERCQEILVSATQPESPPDQGERDQLAELARLTPDIEQPGHWQLYSLGGGLTTIVGVKTFDSQTENLDRASPSAERRVICWGLVFPGLAPGTWTAYAFVRRQGAVTTNPGFELSQVVLPPGCQRTVLMQEAGQGGLLGFRGQCDPAVWQRHFENGLQSRGWKQLAAWSQQAGGWSGRFGAQVPGQTSDAAIQIQFHLENSHQGVGLIHWLPGRITAPDGSPSTSRGTP